MQVTAEPVPRTAGRPAESLLDPPVAVSAEAAMNLRRLNAA